MDGSEVTEGNQDKSCPVYRGKFAYRDISHVLTEQAWHLFLEKHDDYTEYPNLVEQDRVTGYRTDPVDSEGFQENPMPGTDWSVENLTEGVDDNDDTNFDGDTGGESAQRVGMKRKLLDLQNECRSK